jgi:predicted phage terminase large subunit-like protein
MSKRTDRIAVYDRLHAEGQRTDTLRSVMRELCKNDLFYLLSRGCGRRDTDNDWIYERCVEVQRHPDGMLDLWSREHYKSTIITYGKTIQDILVDPEITVGIFSHTKPIARSFLRQIKYELETNEKLKYLFPDVLYAEPQKESPNWSEDKGITVKRASNPKEATVEAHGLVDGQPTSKHFALLVYDDVVTRESVTSPDMIAKTTEAWALSLNLGAHGGRARYIGTRYHYNDTWAEIMRRGSATPRLHPATDNGRVDGKPVFLTQEVLERKRRDMGPYVFACQMLQDPKADEAQGFDEEWLRFWEKDTTEGLNVYILVDPANEKKKESDYTSMWVVGLGVDQNYYILDCIHDRLNLTQRTQTLIQLHRIYRPIGVGYEQYGMQADIQHIEYVQGLKNYRFEITKLGGSTPKNDRIRRLIPLFESGRVYLPKGLIRANYEGRSEDLIQLFINDEYKAFPVMAHDDMLDCLARIVDPALEAMFPMLTIIPTAVSQAERDWRDMTGMGESSLVFNLED